MKRQKNINLIFETPTIFGDFYINYVLKVFTLFLIIRSTLTVSAIACFLRHLKKTFLSTFGHCRSVGTLPVRHVCTSLSRTLVS